MVFDLDQNNTYYYTAQRGNWHFDSIFAHLLIRLLIYSCQ